MRMHPRERTLVIAGIMLIACLALAACGLTSAPGGPDAGVPPSSTTASASGTSHPCGTPITPGASVVATGVVTVVGTSSAQSGAGSVPPTGAQPAEVPAATMPPIPGATVTPARLLVTTTQSTYHTCDPIQVIIANGLSQSVYAPDHQTACTVVTLQEQSGAGWQPIGVCLLETPTTLHAIASGTAVAQTLVPDDGRPDAQGWPTGTYRVAFAYSTALESFPSPRQPHVVYSASFAIG